MARARSWLRLVVLMGVLAGAAAVLHACGRGPLAGPDLSAPQRWSAWLAEVGPVGAALSLVRLLALGAAWYSLGVTALGAAVRLLAALRPSRWARRSVEISDRVTVGPLRRLLAATASLTVAAGAPATAASGALRSPVPLAVVAQMSPVPPPPTTGAAPVVSSPPTTAPPPTLVMRVVVPGGRTAEVTVTSVPTVLPVTGPAPVGPAPVGPAPVGPAPVGPAPVGPAPVGPAPVGPAPAGLAPVGPGGDAPAPAGATVGGQREQWTVARGECFWSIADLVLGRAWGRSPSDAEIVPYWRELIERNRQRLGDPNNADLIYPGQVFEVPPPPAA